MILCLKGSDPFKRSDVALIVSRVELKMIKAKSLSKEENGSKIKARPSGNHKMSGT